MVEAQSVRLHSQHNQHASRAAKWNGTDQAAFRWSAIR